LQDDEGTVVAMIRRGRASFAFAPSTPAARDFHDFHGSSRVASSEDVRSDARSASLAHGFP
jgi:hypothetical protein